MSIKTEDLIAEIERWAPLSGAEVWDNSGWQIDLRQPEVERILVALDPIKPVATEASEKGADFLLSHHPLFFTPIKLIEEGVDNSGTAIHLIKEGISLYSAHTSFDSAPEGMNEKLAEMIGLTGIKSIPDDGTPAFLRCGVFEKPCSFGDICDRVEDALEMQGQLKKVGVQNTIIKTGAVCGGAGGFLLPEIVNAGIDFYLTSDVKHDDALYAAAHGVCLIDGGHWGTEHHFIPMMAERLRLAFGDAIDVIESTVNRNPFC